MKKFLAMLLALVMALSLVACGEKKDDTRTEGGDTATGKVYYLNFKPEQDQDWQDLAKAYTEETGVPVTVLTAASGTYEEKLTSEIAKTDAPTLFQVNGPVGLANWKDYCYDLSSSAVYGELTSDNYALKEDGTGNDYVYVNCMEQELPNPGAISEYISHRRFGIGSDGLIMICKSDVADFKMRMFNADA